MRRQSATRSFAILAGAVCLVSAFHGMAGAQDNVALNAAVTLHGAPFFTGGWGGGLIVDPGTVTDGVFFPRNQQWDQGPVWWDNLDAQSRWMEIDLGNLCEIESLVIQADDNDAYVLSYWDLDSETWQVLWNVPNYDRYGWGMQTRPNPADDSERYALAAPIVTTALKFEGTVNSVDMWFSVSEIQAFGRVIIEVEEVDIDIKPGSFPNSINLGDYGLLPVAILGTDALDVHQIDPVSLELGDVAVTTRGPARAPKLAYSYEDVDGDGDADLMAFFSVQDLVAAGALTETSTELVLTGALTDGTLIQGLDSVRPVPAR